MSVDSQGLHQKVTNLPIPSGQPNWGSAIPKSLNAAHLLQRNSINIHSSSTPSTPRKRTRSFTMDTIPALPNISGDMMLEVFTHSSLRFPRGTASEEYGDNERLSVLGAKAVETAVTYALFCKRPLRSAKQLQEESVEALSDANVDHWLTVYRLREKIRCTPDVVSNLKSPEEGRLLFNSYVGAVFAQSGMIVVQDWITKLIEPPPPFQAPSPDVDPFSKRIKNEPFPIAVIPPPSFSPAFAMHQAHYNPPPSSFSPNPMTPPPPPPTNPPPPLPNSVAPQTHPIAYLPLFNQTANQRRLGVEYPAQFFGPPHAGRWTVRCMVNGIEKGQGTGSSKQLAKEEAAKQAFYALGWANRWVSSGR